MFLYVVVAISSLSLIGFYSYYKAKNALIARATEQLNSVRSIKKVQLGNYLKTRYADSIGIETDALNQILLDTLQTKGLGKTGEVYVVGKDYTIKSKSRFYPNTSSPITADTRSVRTAFDKGEGTLVSSDYRNILCLSSFDTLNARGLTLAVIAEIDYDEAMTPIRNLRNDMVFVSVIMLLLIFSIAQVISSDIIVPIKKMKHSAVKIGKGDFDAKLDISSENEFGVLALSFNQMIDDIQKHTAELLDEKTKRITALFDGQEFERHRISRDLHDGLAQQLIAVKMTFENLIGRNELNDADKLEYLKQQINASIDELRKISYDLAPAGLLEFGIETSLSNLCGQIGALSNLQVDFSAFGEFSNLSRRTKIYLYRIVQEAVSNALKHAEASRIQIQLTETPTHIVLMIEDNGKGFDFNNKSIGLGKGLFNMRERSMLLNGTFDIESSPDKGTTIRVKINKNQQEWET